MLRTLLREILLIGLGLLLLAGGLMAYRSAAGPAGLPPLPEGIEAPIAEWEGVSGWDRRWVLATLGGGFTLGIWLLLGLARSGGAAAPPAAPPPAGRGGRLVAAAAGRRSRGPWLLALAMIGLCAAAIAGLYFAPDTVRIGDRVLVRRMPRDEFLTFLGWGGLALGGAHLFLFLLFALGSRRGPAR